MIGPVCAAMLIACLALGAGTCWADEAQEPSAALAPTAGATADRIAAAWAGLQRADGSFPDEIKGLAPSPLRDRYGDAMMGTALVAYGVRTGREWALRAGWRGLEHHLREPLVQGQYQAFQTLAYGLAYDLGMRALPRHPAFRRVRARLERRLRQLSLQVIVGRRDYYNYYLVEAVGVLAITRHPLRSGNPRAFLHDPRAARARVVAYLNGRLTSQALRGTTGYGGVPLTLLSDQPGNPPAYHAFSVGLLSRATDLLRPEERSAELGTLFDRTARASWALMSPSGDVSWFGRSQEQAWTLAMTAAGTTAGSRRGGVTEQTAGDLRSAALRALQRLERLHGDRRRGIAITPTLVGGATRRALDGIDVYAATASYTGLTLLGLEWLLADPAATAPFALQPIGADADGAFRLARVGEFATVRRGDVWFAVKREPEGEPKAGSDHSHDLRYDAGLNGLELRGPDGSWDDVFPPRPITEVRTDVDTAGPTLVLPGSVMRPEGEKPLAVDPATGLVTLTVRLRRHTGRIVRRNVPFRFRPTACGVEISVPVRRGERWWYSAFFRGEPVKDGDAVTDGRQRVIVGAPFTVRRLARYASGRDAALRRVRITAAAPAAGPLTFTICRA